MMKIRAVLDTNVLIAAFRSRSNSSPNREILDRWENGQFDLIFSDDVLAEYVEKLFEHEIPRDDVRDLIALLSQLGVSVPIQYFHLTHYPDDPDDICFLLCAMNGQASHLVSHDKHLLDFPLDSKTELIICESVPFLQDVRKQIESEE